MANVIDDKLLIGWNEWCQLPQLNLPAIKAKIDTGAKTSALHAFNIVKFTRKHKPWVKFNIHPIQGNNELTVNCQSPLIDERFVMSSNGHKEHRPVIKTTVILGPLTWQIEITLSNRDPLKFRMLLGRNALKEHIIIDPYHTTRQGKINERHLYKLYQR